MKRFNDRESGTGNVRPFSMHLDRIGGESRLFLEAGAEGGGNAAGGEGDGGGGDGGGQQQQQAAPSYTKDEVEKLIEQRLARDRKNRPDESTLRKKILAEEFGLVDDEALKKAKEFIENQADIERKQLEAKGQYEKALQQRQEQWAQKESELKKESETWKGQFESYFKGTELTQAALAAGAEPSSIALLVKYAEGSVKVTDDRQLQVVDYRGEPRYDPLDPSKPMTVQAYLKELLTQYPNLAKSSGTQGGGSKPGGKMGGYTEAELLNISKTDPEKYKELKKAGVIDEFLRTKLGVT